MDRQKFEKRFKSRCKRQPGGCLEWTGARCGPDSAYGQSWLDGRRQMAHRVAWKLWIDPDLPDDVDLDHLCRNPACVELTHLQPVTHQVNIQRGYDHRLAERGNRCAHGHDMTEENTYLTPKGARACRACRRAGQRTFHEANPAKNAEYCRRRRELLKSSDPQA